mmetsp:Transcript_20295/g.51878  ORF Transcript_20295/g.51878 Transcript_20295/m.51878 type:complete len:322 (+) Transcript_20295:67-1032(+)
MLAAARRLPKKTRPKTSADGPVPANQPARQPVDSPPSPPASSQPPANPQASRQAAGLPTHRSSRVISTADAKPARSSLRGELVHRVDERGNQLHAFRPVQALAQVGDERGVAVLPKAGHGAERVEHPLNLPAHNLDRATLAGPQPLRVEVALQCCNPSASGPRCLGLQRTGGLAKVRLSVHADHIVTGRLQRCQRIAGTSGKDHKRHRGVSSLQFGRDLGHRRQCPPREIFLRNVFPHRLEDLQHVCAVLGLCRQILNDDLSEQVQKFFGSFFILCQPPFTLLLVLARRPTDHVEEQRPWGSTEADEGSVSEALFLHLLQD